MLGHELFQPPTPTSRRLRFFLQWGHTSRWTRSPPNLADLYSKSIYVYLVVAAFLKRLLF